MLLMYLDNCLFQLHGGYTKEGYMNIDILDIDMVFKKILNKK